MPRVPRVSRPPRSSRSSRPRHPFLELVSVGPAALRDLTLLGVSTMEELAAADPRELYERLCRLEGRTVDICQYDLFCCAVAQARDPDLPEEQRRWDWWSRRRKAGC